MRVMLLTGVLLCLPTITFGADGFVACGNTGSPECQACFLVDTGNEIIKWLIRILAVLAAMMFAAAGFIWLTAGGDESQIQKGREMLTNSVIGIVIVFGAFLIVDEIITTLVKNEGHIKTSRAGLLGWNEIECVTQPQPDTILADTLARFGPSEGGGSCTPYTSGPCSEEALRAAGFGSLAGDASRIIGQESSCNPSAQSGTDTTTNLRPDGTPYSYSIGIWQINLAVHDLNCGGTRLNCSAAFRDAGSRNRFNVREYTIVDFDLYNRCATAAASPSCNHQKAAELARASGDMGDWACSAKKCGVHTSRNHLCRARI